MNEDNKERLIMGAKVCGLFAWMLLTIATVAGVLNYNPERTIKVFAGILGAWNAAIIVWLFLKVTHPKA